MGSSAAKRSTSARISAATGGRPDVALGTPGDPNLLGASDLADIRAAGLAAEPTVQAVLADLWPGQRHATARSPKSSKA